MKILFVTPCVGSHEAKFVRGLSENGYETRIFSFHYHPVHSEIASLPHVSVDYFRLRVAGRVQRFLPLHFLSRLQSTIKEFRPDILHAGNTWNDSFLSALTGFHPLLVMPYGSDVLLDPDRSVLFRTFNKVAFRRADWVTCDAEHVKRKLIHDYAYPAERITVIPWGIGVDDIAAMRHPWREQTRRELGWEKNFVVIMTRNHEPVYGIDVFLKAMETVISRNANVRVILIGGGPLHEEVRAYIRNHKLEPFFHVTGKIPYTDLLRYLQAADLYVSSSYSDGTSVSLLEAMAARLPAVLTDVPSNLEWVTGGENGQIVKRGDYAALGENILAFAAQPERAKAFGEKSYAIVRAKGDWKNNFKDIETIYRLLVDKANHSKGVPQHS